MNYILFDLGAKVLYQHKINAAFLLCKYYKIQNFLVKTEPV